MNSSTARNHPGMSSQAGGTNAPERRRKSRGGKAEVDRAKVRATNRRRMSVYRAKKKAQQSALLLKRELSDAERADVEARAARRRHGILCDRFRSRRVNFDPEVEFKEEVLRALLTKVELHQIDLEVAEFEITTIKRRGEDALKGGPVPVVSSSSPSTPPPGSLVKEKATHIQAIGDDVCRAPSITDRGGDRGRFAKGIATYDSKSMQALGDGSHPELSNDETKQISQILAASEEEANVSDSPHSDSANLSPTQPFDSNHDPRLLDDDEMSDFLACFRNDRVDANDSQQSCGNDCFPSPPSNFQALPNGEIDDEMNRFFASCHTVLGEDATENLSLSEEEGAAASDSKAASDTEAIPLVSPRSIFGGERSVPALPGSAAVVQQDSKAPGINEQHVAPAESNDGYVRFASSQSISEEEDPVFQALAGSVTGIKSEGSALAANGHFGWRSRSNSECDSFNVDSVSMGLGLGVECTDWDVLSWQSAQL